MKLHVQRLHQSVNKTDIDTELSCICAHNDIGWAIPCKTPPPKIESFNPVALNGTKGVFLTDEHPSYDSVSHDCNKDHRLCAKHKGDNIMKNCDAGKLSGEFLEDMSALIYHRMSIDELDERFAAAKKKYADYPKCLGYITRIEGHKEKVCNALARRLFTFGAVSTQRGEGLNSEVKGKGTLKAMLASADLVTFHDHVQDLFEEYLLKAKKELKKLRINDRKWSDYCNKIWNKSVLLAGNNPAKVTHISGPPEYGQYVVDYASGKSSRVHLASFVLHRGLL